MMAGMDKVHLLSMGSGVLLLWTRWWIFGFLWRRGISWVAERLLASQGHGAA